MAKKSASLVIATPVEWVNAVLADFDSFLADHANCERKANALIMSLIVRYPDRVTIIPQLIELALEELEHFGQTYAFMEKRGLILTKDTPDPYVNELIAAARHGRDERFIDRMLISSLVETRGAERFKILAENLDDPELRSFYEMLWKSEVKHSHVFVHLLLQEFPEDDVIPRLAELAQLESDIMQRMALRPALH
ncbi:MAG: tRNA isopentenyl-2-thiomethyl-A-37 hydroxylase MiaE [Gammaproteobacteria bacterium]